jgi:hypothetical protein
MPKQRTQREITNDLTGYCLKVLKASGLSFKRNNTGTVGRVHKHIPDDEKGWGDIIGCMRGGLHCEFEIKTGDDKQSKYQIAHEKAIKKLHGLYFVIESKDDFDRVFKSLTAN